MVGQVGEQARSVRRAALGAVVLGLLVLSSGWAWAAAVSHDAASLATRTLDTRATAIEEAARQEVQRYSDALDLVAAALGSAASVDATHFDAATAPLTSMDLAGATSLAFIAPPVGDSGLSAFAEDWRSRGSTGLTLETDDARAEHIFPVLSRPLDGSDQRRTGFDLSSVVAPHEALRESQRSGAAAISDAYVLIIDQELPEAERQTSFVVTAPVLSEGRFVGWVLMGLRGQDFLGGVLERAAEGRVDVDLMADDTSGTDLLVASVAGEAGAAADQQGRVVSLPVAQHTWTLQVAADTQALIGDIRHRPLAIQLISVVIALLAAGLWWAVSTSHARSQAQVRTATRELAWAEAQARRQATLLDTMVEAIDDVGVMVVDADGTFLVHSRAARQILGADVADAGAPADWQEHFGVFALDGTPLPEAEMPLVRALGGESTDGVELEIRNPTHPHGVRIAVAGRPFRLEGDRPGALTVFRDVTEERRRQAELSAFTGMVAHDLKNPLALVRGCLELVGDDLPQLSGPPDVVEATALYLVKASAAAGRMSELIDDLLVYTSAADTALEVAVVDLGALVRDTLADIVGGHLAGRRSAGVTVPDPLIHVGDLPVAVCDEERVRQVVANLVGNALKYVEPGTRAVIEVTAELTDDGRGVRLFVADRGIGVPTHLQAEVLKPFVRSPETTADQTNYPGTGLGLAICRRLVERHGGSLRLQPNPGGGTIAVVELPAPGPVTGPETDQPKSADALRIVSVKP